MDNKKPHKASTLPTQIFNKSRVPPQCVDIEEIILSTAINFNDCVSNIMRKCTEEMFYKESNKIVFKAIDQLFKDGSPIDLLLVIQQLKKMKQLEDVGGAYAITTLADIASTPSNIDWHITVLWQTWQKRKIIELGLKYVDNAFDDGSDPIDLVLSLYAELDDMKSIFEQSKMVTISNVVDDALDNIMKRATGEIPPFMKTGYNKLDHVVKFDVNKFIIIAGAQKHMKTRFMISIVLNLLANYPERLGILWYCLEDSTENLLKIMLSNLCMINIGNTDTEEGKQLSPEQYGLIDRMSNRIRSWDVEYRSDTKPIRMISADFASFCKKRENKANVLIIDNALYIDEHAADRDDLIVAELVKLRKATKGLIILVNHFNSEQAKREYIKNAYRPEIQDIKGRESWGRGADAVLLLNKVGNYSSLVAEYPGMEDIFNHLFIVDVAANRHGTANQDDKSLIRFWVLPDYSHFEEI